MTGKQWFGARYAASAHLFGGEIPRWNFVDFYHSFLLVWRVMCGEWVEPLYDCLHITNDDKFCVPLFLLITVIANFMVFLLLLRHIQMTTFVCQILIFYWFSRLIVVFLLQAFDRIVFEHKMLF